jgi:hypothetical protein
VAVVLLFELGQYSDVLRGAWDFLSRFKFWFINLKFRNALNRVSVMPSHTCSLSQSVGTTPFQHSSGSASDSGRGNGSQHGPAPTFFILADEDVADMGGTALSFTRSSFWLVPVESTYHSDSLSTQPTDLVLSMRLPSLHVAKNSCLVQTRTSLLRPAGAPPFPVPAL